MDRKVWPTPAIRVSSLTHPLILGLNFFKLTKSKIDFETSNVETGSTLYPMDTHCMMSSTSTIIIPKSEVYRPPVKKQNKPLASSERNLTWKELLTYGTTVRLKIKLQAARLENTGQMHFLDWMLPPFLAKRLRISNNLF